MPAYATSIWLLWSHEICRWSPTQIQASLLFNVFRGLLSRKCNVWLAMPCPLFVYLHVTFEQEIGNNPEADYDTFIPLWSCWLKPHRNREIPQRKYARIIHILLVLDFAWTSNTCTMYICVDVAVYRHRNKLQGFSVNRVSIVPKW